MQNTKAHFSTTISRSMATRHTAGIRHSAARPEEQARKHAQKQQHAIARQVTDITSIKEDYELHLAKIQGEIEAT
ncbi:hypothetical protein [Sodalis sp. dw_96]|uniref:hypothetical protein n=1 Tax=Sodalis sp. dw_96 TaxID=2719794 RepID=UPI001BD1C843|nr:hypothetical protein [Sodalis sp. dw_96]